MEKMKGPRDWSRTSSGEARVGEGRTQNTTKLIAWMRRSTVINYLCCVFERPRFLLVILLLNRNVFFCTFNRIPRNLENMVKLRRTTFWEMNQNGIRARPFTSNKGYRMTSIWKFDQVWIPNEKSTLPISLWGRDGWWLLGNSWTSDAIQRQIHILDLLHTKKGCDYELFSLDCLWERVPGRRISTTFLLQGNRAESSARSSRWRSSGRNGQASPA